MRLRDFDYAQAGAYFITICTQDRQCLFGDTVDGVMRLNDAGRIVESVWQELPVRFPGVTIDQHVVMPNHFHGIIILVGAQFIAPSRMQTDAGAMNRAPTLGEIVRAFKAASTRLIRTAVRPDFAWQRNYYEHVIRNDDDLNATRECILNNPLAWALDEENPRLERP